MLKIWIYILLAVAMTVPAAAAADTGTRYVDRHFLELLGYLEGPDGYDDITGFARVRPIKPVSTMTIAEVLDYQRLLRQRGTPSSAVGRYQFIYKTLAYMTRHHGIDHREIFDPNMQDLLARLEMHRCGFYDSSRSVTEVGNCLAHVWAALPLLTGKNRGQSRYADTGINWVQTTPEVVEAILGSRVRTGPVMAGAGSGPSRRSRGDTGVRVSDAAYGNGSTIVKSTKSIDASVAGPVRDVADSGAGRPDVDRSDVFYTYHKGERIVPDRPVR